MPPEPQAGSRIRPWKGSMISTINLTREVGVKNSPPRWAFGHGEVAEKILVNLAESVALNLHRNLFHDTQQFDERALFEAVVGLGQDAVHLWVLRLNGFHGVGNRLTDVFILGQIQ